MQIGDGSNSEPPSKRARTANADDDAPGRQKNYIEVNGKSCTHEVAWPPGKPARFGATLSLCSYFAPICSYFAPEMEWLCAKHRGIM
jgi:hypothetical protein